MRHLVCRSQRGAACICKGVGGPMGCSREAGCWHREDEGCILHSIAYSPSAAGATEVPPKTLSD